MKAVEELSPQVGTTAACHSLGVPRATLYRHRQSKPTEPATTRRPKPPRALSEQERQQVVDLLHSEPFADKAPAEVYAALLDQGQYFCSIRTMYRILDDQREVRERRDQLRHPTYHKPQLLSGTNNEAERTLRSSAQARNTGRTNKTVPGARRQTVIVSVLESLRQHLSTFTLSNVIAEIRHWLETGRSCFARLAENLGLTTVAGSLTGGRSSLLDRVLPAPSG